MSPAYVLAWLLPWATGTGLYIVLNHGIRRPGDIPAALGNGLLIGLFLAAALTCWLAADDPAHALAKVSPWLIGIAVLAWGAAYARRRPHELLARTPLPTFWQTMWWLVAAAVIVRLLVLGSEALLRPTFPWDAWSAWAIKPKTWFMLDRFVAYVDPSQWLRDPTASARTSAIWDYPELLAWVQVWFASAAGSWNEPLINLAWTGVLGVLGLACYGQWRALGVGRRLAIGLVYALLSLPLVGAHAALAGYADLWLAAAFGMAVLAWLRWIRHREAGQLALAIAFGFCMPLLKLEGAVWLLGFSLMVALELLPARWRWRATALLLALGLAGIALGGFVFPMLGLGWVHVSWGQVVIPVLGALDLHWRPVGVAMFSGLLTLPNWHLLWYLLPIVVILRWRKLVHDRASAALALLLGLCVGFLFVLFFFTDASAWAENYTSANRLILHVVPAVFSLLALLLADVSAMFPGTDQARPGRIDPA